MYTEEEFPKRDVNIKVWVDRNILSLDPNQYKDDSSLVDYAIRGDAETATIKKLPDRSLSESEHSLHMFMLRQLKPLSATTIAMSLSAPFTDIELLLESLTFKQYLQKNADGNFEIWRNWTFKPHNK